MGLDRITGGSLLQQQAGKSAPPVKGLNGDPTFGELLGRSIQTVNKMQQEADEAARKLVSGENKDIHSTMISMQKAGIAMDLMLEVRNKIISAYDEIKRMQF
jgi:flagellar hook-basal body complex protein FliE